MKTKWVIVLVAAAAAAVGVSGDGLGAPSPGPTTEVVVTLDAPALSRFGRSLSSASHAVYERRLLARQATVVRTLKTELPAARVRWRYHLVLDGFAVTLPRSDLAALARLPGVARVWPSVRYHALDDVSQIGAPQVWGPTLATAGQGMKIGIIDDGVDARHPYFNPSGFAYPPGFPKGDVQYATPKVIVQRAFPAPGQTWKYADTPFDPVYSYHATHVAGIAAGDHGTKADQSVISGVAPAAYIGNYKALTVLTPGFGLDGNSPEIAAAIEAAVADGMNVINLSLGEPEVEPSRDLVVVALQNAARAGVVPVVAAGNEFYPFGNGSVGSPANAPDAIAVGADDSGGVIAYFSSAGPTPISLQMKPDVTAPGVAILSSEPPLTRSTWALESGTSMSTPHVAGAVALLEQRHPTWTVAEIKSALVQTGDPVTGPNGREALTIREGGGEIDVPRADNPLLFAEPSGVSFGRVAAGSTATRTVALSDAGGGAGSWTVAVAPQGGPGSVQAPPAVVVPGALELTATAGTTPGDVTGFVVLTHGADTRRIPYWFDTSAPRLGSETRTLLPKPGIYRGTTKGAPSRVVRYRYPTGSAVAYNGPERAYRVRITGHPANFGVVVLSGNVTPHVTYDGAEDHITGLASLPIDLNPYRESYGNSVPDSAAVLPAPGWYDIVFDTRSVTDAGPFSFRYWVDDTSPPTLRIHSTTGSIDVRATDAGSGVDPSSIVASVDGRAANASWLRGIVHIGARPGRHRLVLHVADYEETKNMEDLPPVLPNTAALRAVVRVR